VWAWLAFHDSYKIYSGNLKSTAVATGEGEKGKDEKRKKEISICLPISVYVSFLLYALM
jgi:hypothetical protein